MSAVLRSAVIDIVLPFWLARRRPARGPSASESGRAGMSSSAVARNASRREIPARDEASIHESRRKTSGMWRQTNLGHSADYLTSNEDLEVDSESKVFGD